MNQTRKLSLLGLLVFSFGCFIIIHKNNSKSIIHLFSENVEHTLGKNHEQINFHMEIEPQPVLPTKRFRDKIDRTSAEKFLANLTASTSHTSEVHDRHQFLKLVVEIEYLEKYDTDLPKVIFNNSVEAYEIYLKNQHTVYFQHPIILNKVDIIKNNIILLYICE